MSDKPAQPHLGNALDQWEQMPNDVKDMLREQCPDFVRAMDALNQALPTIEERGDIEQQLEDAHRGYLYPR